MDLLAITEALRSKMSTSPSLGAVLKFDCGEDGVVLLDGRSSPGSVSNDDAEADCTITISRNHLVALMRGEMNPALGFMSGKFKVSGDMAVALKLQNLV